MKFIQSCLRCWCEGEVDSGKLQNLHCKNNQLQIIKLTKHNLLHVSGYKIKTRDIIVLLCSVFTLHSSLSNLKVNYDIY